MAILDAGATNQNNVWTHNLSFNGNPGEASVRTPDGSPNMISAADGNLLGVHPQLMAPTLVGSGDFHLQAGSPAIGAGTAVFELGDRDLDGKPRSDAQIDLGAYQFATTMLPSGGSASAGAPGAEASGGTTGGTASLPDSPTSGAGSLLTAGSASDDAATPSPSGAPASNTGCSCKVPGSPHDWDSRGLAALALTFAYYLRRARHKLGSLRRRRGVQSRHGARHAARATRRLPTRQLRGGWAECARASSRGRLGR